MSVPQTTESRSSTNVAAELAAGSSLSAGLSLEERMPAMIDDVLGRLSDVGVQGILDLARAMVEARLAAPEASHLAAHGVDQN